MSVTTEIQEVQTAASGYRELNRYLDRCDRCGAEAFFLFVQPLKDFSADAVEAIRDFELTMCAHHGREHEPVARARGMEVHDQSHKINEAPSPSVIPQD